MYKKIITVLLFILFMLMTCNLAFADVAGGPILFIIPLLLYAIPIVVLLVAAIVIIRLIRKRMNKTEDMKEDRNS